MDIAEAAHWVEMIEGKIDNLVTEVSKMQGAEGLTKLLCKWVIFPLILITGALAGLNMYIPGA